MRLLHWGFYNILNIFITYIMHNMQLTSTEKLDLVNIGLMLVSCAIAMILPFELFLIVYAILGPLHYLTEISWLHDRNYFTKGKYDALILLVVGILLMLKYFSADVGIEFPQHFDANLVFIALLSALIFVTVKNPVYKIGGIALVILVSKASHNMIYFLTIFVPTLIHVYLFTALFMLYGAFKSKSRFGVWSVVVLIMCPIILFTVFPNTAFYPPTEYSKGAYDLFKSLNIVWLRYVGGMPKQYLIQPIQWDSIIYYSQGGILLMRFIAFAYTYHYLNWFSKTKVIQWHNVPKWRFITVVIIWLISIVLYIHSYKLGLQWLLFLSFMHVLLELPLNFISILGIGNHIKSKVLKPSTQ